MREKVVMSVRAAVLGTYRISLAASRMRCAVSGLISGLPLSALLTAAIEQLHRNAISLSVLMRVASDFLSVS